MSNEEFSNVQSQIKQVFNAGNSLLVFAINPKSGMDNSQRQEQLERAISQFNIGLKSIAQLISHNRGDLSEDDLAQYKSILKAKATAQRALSKFPGNEGMAKEAAATAAIKPEFELRIRALNKVIANADDQLRILKRDIIRGNSDPDDNDIRQLNHWEGQKMAAQSELNKFDSYRAKTTPNAIAVSSVKESNGSYASIMTAAQSKTPADKTGVPAQANSQKPKFSWSAFLSYIFCFLFPRKSTAPRPENSPDVTAAHKPVTPSFK